MPKATPKLKSTLQQCVVIDPRFSSRKEVLKNLRSLGMFKTVVEAKSVSHALSLLKEMGNEACVVGPSITQDALDDFLDKAEDISSECVFIGIASESGDAPKHELLNATLSIHATQEELSKTIVEAFSAAGIEISASDEKAEAAPEEPPPAAEAPPPEPKPFTLGDLTTGDPRLKLLWSYAQRNKSLKSLPKEERKALDAILDGLTSGATNKEKASRFRTYVEESFQSFGEWAESLSLMEALNELRSILLRFK